MTYQDLPREIEVYEIGARRLYVKTGARNFAISEDDVTPEELVGIAAHIAAQQAKRSEPHIGQAPVTAKGRQVDVVLAAGNTGYQYPSQVSENTV